MHFLIIFFGDYDHWPRILVVLCFPILERSHCLFVVSPLLFIVGDMVDCFGKYSKCIFLRNKSGSFLKCFTRCCDTLYIWKVQIRKWLSWTNLVDLVDFVLLISRHSTWSDLIDTCDIIIIIPFGINGSWPFIILWYVFLILESSLDYLVEEFSAKNDGAESFIMGLYTRVDVLSC